MRAYTAVLSPNSPTSSTTELRTTIEPPGSARVIDVVTTTDPSAESRIRSTRSMLADVAASSVVASSLAIEVFASLADQRVEGEPQGDRGDAVRHDEHSVRGLVGDHRRLAILVLRQLGAALEGGGCRAGWGRCSCRRPRRSRRPRRPRTTRRARPSCCRTRPIRRTIRRRHRRRRRLVRASTAPNRVAT